MRTAFVLSGGANLGASQAGMLQGLYEHDVCPDLFVGTSAGALNAAFAAFRPPTIDSALELGEVWRGVRGAQVFPPNLRRAGLGLLGLRDHAMSPGRSEAADQADRAWRTGRGRSHVPSACCDHRVARLPLA